MDAGYGVSNFAARASGEIATGLLTGGLSQLNRAGTAARVAAKAALAYDTAGNALAGGRGAVDVYQNGLGFGSGVQIVGGALGLSSNLAAGGRALQEIAADTSRVRVGIDYNVFRTAQLNAGGPLNAVKVSLAPNELRISTSQYPQLAENIRHAQAAGHPSVLTHGGDVVANRSAALRGVPQIPHLTRDEYPFASSLEGGIGAWVGHIPREQQNAQGALIKNSSVRLTPA